VTSDEKLRELARLIESDATYEEIPEEFTWEDYEAAMKLKRVGGANGG